MAGSHDAARRLRALAADAASLTLAQTAPNPDRLAVLERELKPLFAPDAPAADPLRLARGGPPCGEAQVGVDAQAGRIVLPVLRENRWLRGVVVHMWDPPALVSAWCNER